MTYSTTLINQIQEFMNNGGEPLLYLILFIGLGILGLWYYLRDKLIEEKQQIQTPQIKKNENLALGTHLETQNSTEEDNTQSNMSVRADNQSGRLTNIKVKEKQ